MKNQLKILATLLLVWLFLSCGTRKVSIDKQKEEIKSETVDNSVIEKQSESNVKTTTTTKVYDKNEIVTHETIYEPADNTKESFVIEKDGTKVILNNSKKIVRNTTQNNNTKSETNNYVDSVRKEIQKENKAIHKNYASKKEAKAKQTESKNRIPLWIWIVSIIIIIIFTYLTYKFVKN